MDFTIKIYKELLTTLVENGYAFQTFEEFLLKPKVKVVILRHDVDLLPKNSLRFAEIQYSLGIKGTYYFRAVPESWDDRIINKIASYNHEIGYHYENLTTSRGELDLAMEDFDYNLKELRKLSTVSTICMHGSPMSKYDSKDLWIKYDYKKFGIIGEPYFDIDFNKVFYLTDTGRRWDGFKVSVRDRVNSNFDQNYRTSRQIMQAINDGEVPNQIMFTFHPQRWHDNILNWVKELILQNLKNIIKKYFFVPKNKKK